MRAGDFTRAEISSALAGKVGAEARAIARGLAERFGISLGHVYRLTGDARSTGRARRRDRGKTRIKLSSEIEDFMLGLTREADMSADHVLWVTARHFGLEPNFMAIATYNGWLRRQRMSRALLKKDLRPYRAFEAPRANFLHHYDTTVAEAFYVNDDGSIGNEPGYQRYKNKVGNRRPRLILYSLIDDHSRVLYARFYISENTLNLLDFVFNAWSEKSDRRFPCYGIPEFFFCDQGAPAKSMKFKNAERKLGFKILDTTPSHSEDFGSRKHGKVERTFGEGLLGEFMKVTKIFRFASIEELNATLFEWLIHINNRASRATGEVRFERWIRSAGTPRSMPSEEMFKLLHYDRAMPTVRKNLQFQLNGKIFQLPYRKPFINWVDAKIEAYWYPGQEEAVTVVYDFHEEEIKALAPVIDVALDYKSVEKTAREKRLEEIKGANYSKVNFPAIYTPEKELPYLPRKGEEFNERAIAEKTVDTGEGKRRPSFAPERWLVYVAAARQLQEEDFLSRPLSAAEQAWLKGKFAGRQKISETELNDAVKAAKAQSDEASALG